MCEDTNLCICMHMHVSLYTRDHNYNHLKVLTPNKHEDMVWPTQKSSFLDWCINHSYRYWSQKHFIYTQNLALLDIDTVTHGHCARGRHLQRMLRPLTSIKSNKKLQSQLLPVLCAPLQMEDKTDLFQPYNNKKLSGSRYWQSHLYISKCYYHLQLDLIQTKYIFQLEQTSHLCTRGLEFH